MAEFKFTDLVEPVAVDKTALRITVLGAVALVRPWQI